MARELSDLGRVSLLPPVAFVKRRGWGSSQFHGAVVPLHCETTKGPKVLALQVQHTQGLTMYVVQGCVD